MTEREKTDKMNAAEMSLQIELNKYHGYESTEVRSRDLSDSEIESLSKKIEVIPLELRSILYFYYCMHFSEEEIGTYLKKDQIHEKRIYTERLLSEFMNLQDVHISASSMEQACEIVMRRETVLEDAAGLPAPSYSDQFRKTLKAIPAARKKPIRIATLAKRAAVFVAAATLCCSVAFAANAGLREQLIAWIVEVTQEYSKFKAVSSVEGENVDLESFTITYIPEGFELSNSYKSKKLCQYDYESSDGALINMTLTTGDVSQFLNTENIVTNEFKFKGETAYKWYNNSMNYLVWQQDGILCRIRGKISLDEIIQIANSVKR